MIIISTFAIKAFITSNVTFIDLVFIFIFAGYFDYYFLF